MGWSAQAFKKSWKRIPTSVQDKLKRAKEDGGYGLDIHYLKSFFSGANLTQEAPLKIDPNFTSSNLSLSNRNQFSASTRGRWCFIFASYVKILPLGQNMSKIIHFECK